MSGRVAPHRCALKVDRIAMRWLYPRLRALPPELWDSTLRKARDTDFETVEWVGMVGGVAFIAWLAGVDALALTTLPPVIAFLIRFLFALPLLAVVVGPIYLRRTRRGLDRELARRETRDGNAPARSGRKEE